MADPGEGPGGPPLFFHQTEARRAEKNFFGDTLSPPPPPPLFKGRDDRGPHYLKVWIRH